MKKLITIVGATGSGKSSLGIKLAKKFKGEIISTDSRQIYKEMNIGTGKVTKDEMDGVSHYLLDIINPDQDYSLAQFKDKAIKVIFDIQSRGSLPMLVGGTGLYIQAVIDNLDIPRVPPDKQYRAKLEKKITQDGLASVFAELLKLDPTAKDVVDPLNPRRVIRALEVCKKTTRPFTSFYRKSKPLFNVLQVGLQVDREQLYTKIDKRVDQMVEQGLIDEVKKLLSKYSPELPSMSGIGYKEIGQYLKKELSLEEAIQKIKYRTHAYARRQLTWFGRDKRIQWVGGVEQAEDLVKKFVERA